MKSIKLESDQYFLNRIRARRHSRFSIILQLNFASKASFKQWISLNPRHPSFLEIMPNNPWDAGSLKQVIACEGIKKITRFSNVSLLVRGILRTSLWLFAESCQQ